MSRIEVRGRNDDPIGAFVYDPDDKLYWFDPREMYWLDSGDLRKAADLLDEMNKGATPSEGADLER